MENHNYMLINMILSLVLMDLAFACGKTSCMSCSLKNGL